MKATRTLKMVVLRSVLEMTSDQDALYRIGLSSLANLINNRTLDTF